MPLLSQRKHLNARARPRRLRAWVLSMIATLHPGCFAFVMATGIISNALFLEGFRRLSQWLFVTNALAYVWLAILTMEG
jgi:hypothetical protein